MKPFIPLAINYLRLQHLMLKDLALPVLRDHFHRCWELKHGYKWEDEGDKTTSNKDGFIDKLIKSFYWGQTSQRRHLNKEMIHWDFQLLLNCIKVILNFDKNFSSKMKPLNDIRNDLAHMAEAEVKEADFQRMWAEGSAVLLQLGVTQTELDDRRVYKFDHRDPENIAKAELLLQKGLQLKHEGKYAEANLNFSLALSLRGLEPDTLVTLHSEICSVSNTLEKRVADAKLLAESYLNIQKFEGKWWPEKKPMTQSFYKRKINDKLFVTILKAQLEDEDSTMKQLNKGKLVITGPAGVGKSSLAKWFANHFQDEFEHIIWIDCEKGRLDDSWANLAMDLNVAHWERLKGATLARKCFQRLAGKKVLLIYDNAESYGGPGGLEKLLSPENEESKGFMSIITSRCTSWGNETGFDKIGKIYLSVFGIEESVEFLKEHINGLNYTDTEYSQLATHLGNLPLALQLAVTTLNMRQMTLPEYLIRIESTDILLSPVTELDDYEKHIGKIIDITLQTLKESGGFGQLAITILEILSFLRPDEMDMVFLSDTLATDLYEVEEACFLLEKYCLISMQNYITMQFRRTSDNPNDGLQRTSFIKSYTLISNPVIQQIVRSMVKEPEDILKKILESCGQRTLKLNAVKYAEKYSSLKEFMAASGEFTCTLDLFELVRERQFGDALILSKLINQKQNSCSSNYNYALCLAFNKKFELALGQLLAIYDDLSENARSQMNIVKLTLVNDEELPDKFSLGILCLILLKKTGGQEDAGKAGYWTRLSKSLELNSIEIQNHGFPFDLTLIKNVKHVKFDSTYLECSGISSLAEETDSSQYYNDNNPSLPTVNTLELDNVRFLDNFGQDLPLIFFKNLVVSFQMRELVIDCKSVTPIVVDLSQLPNTVAKAHFTRTFLISSRTGIWNSSSLIFLKLTDLQINTKLQEILPACRKLVELQMEELKFPVELTWIPESVKELLLRQVKIVGDPSKLSLNQLVLLNCKSFDEISNLLQRVSVVEHTILIFESSIFNRGAFVKTTGNQSKWIELIDRSNRISIGGCQLGWLDYKHFGLEKYGICESSKFYSVDENKIGKILSEQEFYRDLNYTEQSFSFLD